MFASLSTSVRLARDVAFVREVFRDDIALLLSSLVARYVTANLEVANNTTETVALGDVTTGRLLYVKASRQVTVLVSYDGTADQELLIGKDATAEGFLLSTCLFDAVKITNASGAAVEVLVFLGGV